MNQHQLELKREVSKMDRRLITIGEHIVKNTHLNLNLSGWPAAVSVGVFCAAGVAIIAIAKKNTSNPSEKLQKETQIEENNDAARN